MELSLVIHRGHVFTRRPYPRYMVLPLGDEVLRVVVVFADVGLTAWFVLVAVVVCCVVCGPVVLDGARSEAVPPKLWLWSLGVSRWFASGGLCGVVVCLDGALCDCFEVAHSRSMDCTFRMVSP